MSLWSRTEHNIQFSSVNILVVPITGWVTQEVESEWEISMQDMLLYALRINPSERGVENRIEERERLICNATASETPWVWDGLSEVS